jgi:predicted PurR-regulated permease PerM
MMILGLLIMTVGLTVSSQGEQLIDIIDSISGFLNSLVPLIERIEESLENCNLQIDLSVIESQLRNQAVSILVTILAMIQSILTNFSNFIFIAVVAFFMLLDGERLWEFITKVVPQNRGQRFTNIIRGSFLGFFVVSYY